MKTANAEPPHPRIKRMILEAIYERNDELDRFSIV
jgi:hypothetical protein